MPRTRISNAQNLVTALANNAAVVGIVPAAAANFKLLRLVLGINNGGAAITDFEVSVALNRATARGTATTTTPFEKSDPASGPTGITGLDVVYSVQPTLAAADSEIFSFNSRGGAILNFGEGDIISDVGLAKPLVLVNRSGAALPVGHAITVGVEIFE